jgi:hypothetical protein
MIYKPNAVDVTSRELTLGDTTMTVQKIYSRTNPIQASENPNGKAVAQVDEALRDFVLQDTAHLRREAETASQGASRREPESATEVVAEVNSLVQRVAGVSLDELDDAIVDLRQLRDFLYSEGERIQREISGYLQLNQVAMGSTKSIVDSIGQWKAAAVALRPGKGRAQAERSDITASPSVAPPS